MTRIKGYEVVLEQGEEGNWGGYFEDEDGPSVFAVGDTREEVQRLMEEGLDIWLEEEAKDAAARQNGVASA
ncbi:MAG TPA: type II toxin-antitoxin system HicB family antitoxin [Solirubrobacteraceae bacterium]|nr:type II toxin-antitoxin system HicB family antitoxin [Solirubrobacteraceae bacterium]